jgi:hypothetical protein
VSDARYRFLPPDEVAALTPAERVKYTRERAAFDDEVVAHRLHIEQHGWIDVGTKGRVVRFNVPVKLVDRRRR